MRNSRCHSAWPVPARAPRPGTGGIGSGDCSTLRVSSTATSMHEGWVVRVRGDRIEQVGPAASVDASGATSRDLPGLTLLPGLIEGPLARPAASVQRDRLERPGAEGVARPAHRARDHAPARDADGRLHDDPGSGHGRRGLRRRRTEAGHRAGHHPGPADAGLDARDRRDRQLRAEGLLARVEGPAGRRGSRPRLDRPHRPRPDRPRRRLGQGLRRLPLGAARRDHADLLAGRDEGRRGDRAQQRPPRGRARDGARRACGARSWPASRPSSTATKARPRSSS